MKISSTKAAGVKLGTMRMVTKVLRLVIHSDLKDHISAVVIIIVIGLKSYTPYSSLHRFLC